MAAIGSIRSREAVRALLSLGGEAETPPSVREAVFRSLARLTGLDFGLELAPWSLWFTQVEWQPEAEWRRMLVESLAARTDNLALDRDQTTSRLVDELRRTFGATVGHDARSRMLESFIRDPLHPVRRLGFALALQDLANARPLDAGVATAAFGALQDPSVEIRCSAAGLLFVIAPFRLAPDLRDALVRETDPAVAAPLLKLAARWPAENVRPAVLRWLTYGTDGPADENARGARAAALEAADALVSAGSFQHEPERAQVLSVVRDAPLQELPPCGVRLLFRLGSEADARDALGLITTGDAERRRAVAEALAAEPGALGGIVQAAKADIAIYSVAASALATHRPDAAGYRELAALPAPSADERRRTLIAFSSKLRPGDLLAVALGITDANMREALLARLVNEPLERRFGETPSTGTHWGHGFTQSPSVVAGLLLLARTRLDLSLPADAVRALDALAQVSDRVESDERDSVRTTALVWANQIDDALAAGGPIDAWIEGLERCIKEPHAAAVLGVIDGRFGADVTAAQAERLRPLRERLGMTIGPAAEHP